MQPAASWQITWRDAAGIPRQAAVPPAGLRIGRAPENDIVLDDPMVSRLHAVVTVRDGRVTVDASASTNGIVVGGRETTHATGSAALTFDIGLASFAVGPVTTPVGPARAIRDRRLPAVALVGAGAIAAVVVVLGSLIAFVATSSDGPGGPDGLAWTEPTGGNDIAVDRLSEGALVFRGFDGKHYAIEDTSIPEVALVQASLPADAGMVDVPQGWDVLRPSDEPSTLLLVRPGDKKSPIGHGWQTGIAYWRSAAEGLEESQDPRYPAGAPFPGAPGVRVFTTGSLGKAVIAVVPDPDGATLVEARLTGAVASSVESDRVILETWRSVVARMAEADQ